MKKGLQYQRNRVSTVWTEFSWCTSSNHKMSKYPTPPFCTVKPFLARNHQLRYRILDKRRRFPSRVGGRQYVNTLIDSASKIKCSCLLGMEDCCRSGYKPCNLHISLCTSVNNGWKPGADRRHRLTICRMAGNALEVFRLWVLKQLRSQAGS